VAVSGARGLDGRFSRVEALIAGTAAAASVALAAGLPSTISAVRERPAAAGVFLGLSLVLQLFAVEAYGKGMIGVSAVAKLAAGFTLGPGFAMATALVTAVTHSSRRHALGRRAVYDAANWVLSAGAAALAYGLLVDDGDSTVVRFGVATLAGAIYTALNNGLLCLAMALSEGATFVCIWKERFHWARFHFLSYGALALAVTLAYDRMGVAGVVAFSLPPVLMAFSVRAYLEHTRQAVEKISEANRKMRQAHRDTIAALSRCMEAKDFDTGGHTERVADLSVALARRLGYGGEDLDAIEIGALLHDIGKVAVPEQILHKPTTLTPDEWEVIKQHPIVSEFILADTDLHPIVCQIARSSHERIDGCGYPDGLVGDAIPMPARIVLVADAFDAITSDRPYRAGRSRDEALAELREHSGTQFCPRVLRALERICDDEPELLAAVPLRRLVAA
jgi:putative nucleotidyltransferase with HDIG domain